MNYQVKEVTIELATGGNGEADNWERSFYLDVNDAATGVRMMELRIKAEAMGRMLCGGGRISAIAVVEAAKEPPQ